MAKYHQGLYNPVNPAKYVGDLKNIVYRSRWELVLFRTLDKHPDVLEWGSETFFIPYISPLDNRWHRYYPDVFIKQKNKEGKIEKIVIEIKPYKETQPPNKNKAKKKPTKRFLYENATYAKNRAKWYYAEKFCKKRGIRFEIMTEKELFGK